MCMRDAVNNNAEYFAETLSSTTGGRADQVMGEVRGIGGPLSRQHCFRQAGTTRG